MSTIKPFPILLPNNANHSKWAIIACDQFTSNGEYWSTLENFVGNDKSCLHMILPEIYLSTDNESRTKECNRTMREYLKDGTFYSLDCGMVLVERSTSYGNTRRGIVTSIDLETYSYEQGIISPVRATEATVPNRLPPRIAMRERAALEIPHVLILADDKENIVFNNIKTGKNLYDFDLNMDGGHLTGYEITNTDEIIAGFESLKKDTGLIFAVGDGNHSLASAKAHWDKLKIPLTTTERECHPARYALVEIENIYDDGIKFEPIHRVVFGDVLDLKKTYARPTFSTCAEFVRATDAMLLDYGKNHKITVDYVHGEDDVIQLERDGAFGILMPKMQKSELFEVVNAGKVLPKKCFSMGEAKEKRYYFECKKI